MADIVSEVTAIIVNKLGVDESEVTRNASFTNDLGAFEKKFNIEIPDDAAEKISTVGEAIDYIEEHTK